MSLHNTLLHQNTEKYNTSHETRNAEMLERWNFGILGRCLVRESDNFSYLNCNAILSVFEQKASLRVEKWFFYYD